MKRSLTYYLELYAISYFLCSLGAAVVLFVIDLYFDTGSSGATSTAIVLGFAAAYYPAQKFVEIEQVAPTKSFAWKFAAWSFPIATVVGSLPVLVTAYFGLLRLDELDNAAWGVMGVMFLIFGVIHIPLVQWALCSFAEQYLKQAKKDGA